jgi:anti-sigma factor RsiW
MMLWRKHPETAFAPYLRGELDASESRRLQEHLAECARCREGLAAAESVMGALARRVEQLQEPDWTAYQVELRRKLNARRYRTPAERRRYRWAWASLAAATVATSAIVLGIALSAGPHAPAVDQLVVEGALADADIGMLRDYPMVENLDLLENYDVIENLDQLTPPSTPHHESRPS